VQGQDLLESIKTNRRRMMGHGLKKLIICAPPYQDYFPRKFKEVWCRWRTSSSFQGNWRKNGVGKAVVVSKEIQGKNGVVSLWVVGQLLLVHCSNKKTNPKKSWNSAGPEISVAIYACYSWQAFLPTSSQNHLSLIFMFWLVCVFSHAPYSPWETPHLTFEAS